MTTRIAVKGTGIIAYYLGREPKWAHDQFMKETHDYESSNEEALGYVAGLVAVIIDKDGFTFAYFCDEAWQAKKIVDTFAGGPNQQLSIEPVTAGELQYAKKEKK